MIPRIVAQRGASSSRPENTHAAIVEAIRGGADVVEIDVQASADGELFVHHDFELGRTTNGEGLVVSRNSAYLLQLDAGSWFDTQYGDQTIPLLGDVLDAYGGQVQFQLDLRGFTGTFVHTVFEMVEDFHLTADVTVISRQLPLLLVARERQPDVRLGIKAPDRAGWMDKVVWQALTLADVQMITPDLVAAPIALLDRYLVERTQALDVAVQAVGCQGDDDLHQATEMEVDELVT